MSNQVIIDSLKSGLQQNPEGLPLRLHLADLLLSEQQWESAQEHFQFVLQRDPVNLQAA